MSLIVWLHIMRCLQLLDPTSKCILKSIASETSMVRCYQWHSQEQAYMDTYTSNFIPICLLCPVTEKEMIDKL